MRKNVNTCNIEGLLYESALEEKIVQNQQSANFGKPFIKGSISVATDPDGLNVITTYYTYVSPTTRSGGANTTYNMLKKLMESGKTVVEHGAEQATKVKLTSALALNDFYPNGEDNLVSQLRSEGGFVSIVNEINSNEPARKKFMTDIVINQVIHVEADPEKHIDKDFLKIRGVIFDFKNAILPVEFVVKDPSGINYFESLNISNKNKIYTQVSGEINNTTIVVERTLESAFGGPQVDISETHSREFVITWAKPIPYIYNDEKTITDEELEKAAQDRAVYLEEVKTKAKEYYESKRAQAATAANTMPNPGMPGAIPAGQFNFGQPLF